MIKLRHIAAPVLVIILSLGLFGCGRDVAIEYIPEGGSYTLAEAAAVAQAADISALADVSSDAIAKTRQEYLTELRGLGSDASLIADALTRDFPLDTAAVPVLIEGSIVESRPVWLIVEAWAEDGGTLSHRRLWLLDRETFALVDSMSFR